MTCTCEEGCVFCDDSTTVEELRDRLRDAHASQDLLRGWVQENRAEATKAWAVVEHLEMEISEKTAWIERDRREPDKVLLNVASLRRALERRNAVERDAATKDCPR